MTNAFWDRIRRNIFNTWWWCPLTERQMWEKFFILDVAIPCKDIEWCGLRDSPHADQIAKFIDILTMGLAKKNVVNLFFKLMKIKRIIKLFSKWSPRWNIATSQLWCSCENVSKYVSRYIFILIWVNHVWLSLQVHKCREVYDWK